MHGLPAAPACSRRARSASQVEPLWIRRYQPFANRQTPPIGLQRFARATQPGEYVGFPDGWRDEVAIFHVVRELGCKFVARNRQTLAHAVESLRCSRMCLRHRRYVGRQWTRNVGRGTGRDFSAGNTDSSKCSCRRWVSRVSAGLPDSSERVPITSYALASSSRWSRVSADSDISGSVEILRPPSESERLGLVVGECEHICQLQRPIRHIPPCP